MLCYAIRPTCCLMNHAQFRQMKSEAAEGLHGHPRTSSWTVAVSGMLRIVSQLRACWLHMRFSLAGLIHDRRLNGKSHSALGLLATNILDWRLATPEPCTAELGWALPCMLLNMQ